MSGHTHGGQCKPPFLPPVVNRRYTSGAFDLGDGRSLYINRGLGHLLMRKMIAFLAGRGTQRLVGYVLRENDAMQRLARSHGLVVDKGASDADMLCFVLELPGRSETTGGAATGAA